MPAIPDPSLGPLSKQYFMEKQPAFQGMAGLPDWVNMLLYYKYQITGDRFICYKKVFIHPVFTESAHWADSVIESRCPWPASYVCPLPVKFISRPLIGPQVT